MSEIETEKTEAADGEKFVAKLIRGRYYDACGKVWDRTQPGKDQHVITAEEKSYLERTSALLNNVGGDEVDEPDVVETPRFSFTPVGSVPTSAPRSRRRA